MGSGRERQRGGRCAAGLSLALSLLSSSLPRSGAPSAWTAADTGTLVYGVNFGEGGVPQLLGLDAVSGETQHVVDLPLGEAEEATVGVSAFDPITQTYYTIVQVESGLPPPAAEEDSVLVVARLGREAERRTVHLGQDQILSMHFDALHNRLLAVTYRFPTRPSHPPAGAWFATIDPETGMVFPFVSMRASATGAAAVPVPGMSAFDKSTHTYYALGADHDCDKPRVFAVDTVSMVGYNLALPVASAPLECDVVSLECESTTGLLLAMVACEANATAGTAALTEMVRVNGTSGEFESRGKNSGSQIPAAAGMLSSAYDDVASSYFSVFDEQGDAEGSHLVTRNAEVFSTICGSASEDFPLRLRCSSGTVTAIDFASFGTPEGSCRQFSTGWCHAMLSKQIMEDACIGQQECTVDADMHVFGDPCVNASKHLHVQATCSGQSNRHGTHAVASIQSDGSPISSPFLNIFNADAPFITSVVPGSGLLDGTTVVTVEGQNFFRMQIVSCAFNGTSSAGTVTGSSVACVSPPAPTGRGERVSFELAFQSTEGDVVTTRLSNAVGFHYYEPEYIESVFPAMGPMTGGTVVKISSDGFLFSEYKDMTCKFDGGFSVSARLIDNRTVACVTPESDGLAATGIEASSTEHPVVRVPLTGFELADLVLDEIVAASRWSLSRSLMLSSAPTVCRDASLDPPWWSEGILQHEYTPPSDDGNAEPNVVLDPEVWDTMMQLLLQNETTGSVDPIPAGGCMVSDAAFEGVNGVWNASNQTKNGHPLYMRDDGWEISWLAGSWYINNSAADQSAYHCETTTGTDQPVCATGWVGDSPSPNVTGDCSCGVGYVWDSVGSVCTDTLAPDLNSLEFRMTGVSEVHLGPTFRQGLSANASIYSVHPHDLNRSAVLVQGGLGMVVMDDSKAVRVSGHNWTVVNGSGAAKTYFGDTVVSIYPDRTVIQCAGDGCEGTSVTCAELAERGLCQEKFGDIADTRESSVSMDAIVGDLCGVSCSSCPSNCFDGGPYTCVGGGCPAPSVGCATLAAYGLCRSVFGDLPDLQDETIEPTRSIGDACPISCDTCDDDALANMCTDSPPFTTGNFSLEIPGSSVSLIDETVDCSTLTMAAPETLLTSLRTELVGALSDAAKQSETVINAVNGIPIVVDLEQFEHFAAINESLSDTFRYDPTAVPDVRRELEKELQKFAHTGAIDGNAMPIVDTITVTVEVMAAAGELAGQEEDERLTAAFLQVARRAINATLLRTEELGLETELIWNEIPAFDLSVANMSVFLKFSNNGQQYVSNQLRFTYYQPVLVLELDPTNGPDSGDTEIIVTGANFLPGPGLKCRFGDPNDPGMKQNFTEAPDDKTLERLNLDPTLANESRTYFELSPVVVDANFFSPSKITCRAPPWLPANVTVRVTNNDQQYGAASRNYEYYSAPHVHRVVPHVGPIRGGTRVTLYGESFLPDNNLGCIFDGIEVEAEYVSSSEMVCISPEHPPGPVAVNMTVNGQQFTNDGTIFNYYELAEIYPPRGPSFGETQVRAIGHGFVPTANMTCRFNEGSYIKAEYLDSETLLCIAPAHAEGSVSFEINAYGGESSVVGLADTDPDYDWFDELNAHGDWTESGLSYSYYVNPTVTSIDPILGPNTGGTVVTVVGERFLDTETLRCRFGTVNSSQVLAVVTPTYISSELIRCISPIQIAGIHDISISNNDQQYCNALPFDFYLPPQVYLLSPHNGPSHVQVMPPEEQTIIILQGENYKEPTDQTRDLQRCRFGETVVAAEYVSTQLMRCLIPLHVPAVVPLEITMNGQQYSNNRVNFHFYGHRELTTISPIHGNSDPAGTEVHVFGTNFVDGPDISCTFAGVPVQGYYVSADEIYCPTPIYGSGSVFELLGESQVDVPVLATTNQQQYYTVPILYMYSDTQAELSFGTNLPGVAEGLGDAVAGDVGQYSIQAMRPDGAPKFTGRDRFMVDFVGSTILVGLTGQRWQIDGQFVTLKLQTYEPSSTLPTGGYLVDNDDGSYTTKYNVTVSGSYQMAVKLAPDKADLWTQYPDIIGSPFTVVVAPAATFVPLCNAHGQGLIDTEAGHIPRFTIQARDRFNNTRAPYQTHTDRFDILVSGKNVFGEGTTSVGSHINNNDGTYDATYGPLVKAGYYHVEVSTDSENILGSPYETIIHPSYTSSYTSFAYGPGTISAVAGYDANVYVTSIDIYNNERWVGGDVIDAQLQELGAHGRATAPDVIAEVIDPDTGKYNLTYNATFAGEYRLAIKVLECGFVGCGVDGKPEGVMLGIAANDLVDYWEVTVYPAEPYAAKSTAVGLGDAPWDGLIRAQTGVANQIQVDAYDRFGNRKTSGGDGTFFFTMSGGYPTSISVSGDLDDMGDGRHILSYNVSQSGPYYIAIGIFTSTLGDVPDETLLIPRATPSFSCVPRSTPLRGGATISIAGDFYDRTDFKNYLEWVGTNDVTIRLRGTINDGTRWGVPTDETLVGQFVPATGMIVFTTPPFALPGDLTLEMRAPDQDWTDTDFQFQLYREPSVFTIAPHAGPVTGGTQVQIAGELFVETDEVRCSFGPDLSVPAVVMGPSDLRCTSPPSGITDTYDLVVRVALNGQQYTDTDVDYMYYAAPVVLHSSQPSSGPVSGNTQLTIYGDNFIETNLITCFFDFPNANVSGFVSPDGNVICRSPNSVRGPATGVGGAIVKVALNGQQFTATHLPFRFYEDVSVTQVLPDSGSFKGGTELVVSGEKYVETGEIACRFGVGAYDSTGLIGDYDTSGTVVVDRSSGAAVPAIRCDTPTNFPQADTVTLEVALNGQQFTTNGLLFHFVAQVDDISPVRGPAQGDTMISVHGEGFTDTGSLLVCHFGDLATVPAIFNSSNLVFCVSPLVEEARSTVELELSMDGGVYLTDNHNEFSYYKTPHVVAIGLEYPSATVLGAQYLTIHGTEFAYSPQLAVRFGFDDVVATASIIVSGDGMSPVTCFTPDVRRDARFPTDVFVEVTMNGQQYTADRVALNFYDPRVAPTIQEIRPGSGRQEGSTKVTFRGTNFANVPTLECSFAGRQFPDRLQATFVSSNEMFCYSPPNYAADGVTYTVGLRPVTITNGNLRPFGQLWTQQEIYFRYTMTDPSQTWASGPGLRRDAADTPFIAGTVASFTIQAVRQDGEHRITGGDTFYAEFRQVCSDVGGERCTKNSDGEDDPYVYVAVTVDLDYDVQDQLLRDGGFDYIEAMKAATLVNETLEAAKGLVEARESAGRYYTIQNVTVSGRYTLSVQTAGQDIVDSPFPIFVQYDEISQENCGVTGTGADIALAGEQSTLFVQARDRFGNNRTAEITPFDAELAFCSNNSHVPCTPEAAAAAAKSLEMVFLSASEGMSAFVYTTTVAGTYELRITSYGDAVAGTPRPLPVRPAPTHAPSCEITSYPDEGSLTYPQGVFAGGGADVGIATYDRYKNAREVGGDEFVVLVVGNESLSAHVVDHGDSTYNALFNVTVSGVHLVSIKFDGAHIGGSPRNLLIRPAAIDPSKCRPSGPGTYGAAVGATNRFQIQARDRFGNKRDESDGHFLTRFFVDTLLDPYRGDPPPKNFTSSYLGSTHPEPRYQPGLYEMAYNLSEAGNYIMTTEFEGQRIIQGWLRIYVEPAPVYPPACVATGAGISDTVAGSETFLLLQLRDKFHNDQIDDGQADNITVILERQVPLPLFWNERPDLAPERVRIADIGRGMYNISYLVYPSILYKLHVQFDEQEIKNSPFSIQKTRAPPPRIEQAKFDDSLIRITVKFDIETNQARMNAESTCGDILPQDLVTALGAGPMCQWKTGTELSVSLGYKSSITTTAAARLDDWDLFMEMAPTKLLGFFENTYPVNNSKPILEPTNPPTPVAILEAPVLVGRCDPMTINAAKSYGGGPRPLRFTWDELEHPNQRLKKQGGLLLQNYLQVLNAESYNSFRQAEEGHMRISIDKNDTDAGQVYNWTVKIQSFINQVGVGYITAQKEAAPLPIVFIRGPSDITVFRSEEIIIQGDAALPGDGEDPDCPIPEAWRRIGFEWLIDDPTVYIKPATIASRTLFLPEATLEAYHVYKLNLTAWMQLYPDDKNYAVVTVRVSADRLRPAIKGGDRIVGNDQNLTLDASMSLDPDDIEGSPILYSWSCFMTYSPEVQVQLGMPSGRCVDMHGNYLRLPNREQEFTEQSIVNIPALTLSGMPDGLPHVFSLNVSKETNVSGWHDIRYSSTSVTISVVPGAPPTIIVDPLMDRKVNPSKRVVFTAKATSVVPHSLQPLRWFVLQGTLNLDDFSVSTTGREGENLVINPNKLIPGQTYKFRLQAEDDNGISYGQLTVPVNAAPASGIFTVRPPNGTALTTTFILQNKGWADDPEDMPLVYRFSYIKGAEVEKPLVDLGPNEVVEAVLPQGPESNKSLQYTFANTPDDDTSQLQASVQITGAISKSEFVEHVKATINSLINASFEVDDVRYSQTVRAVLSVPGGQNITQNSAAGVQFRDGVAAAAGEGVTAANVTITERRRLQQSDSTLVLFTVTAGRDLSHTLADAQIIADSINAVGSLLQLNSTAVAFAEQPSYSTFISYVVRITEMDAGFSRINDLTDAMDTNVFADELTHQLAASHPELVVVVNYITPDEDSSGSWGDSGSWSESGSWASADLTSTGRRRTEQIVVDISRTGGGTLFTTKGPRRGVPLAPRVHSDKFYRPNDLTIFMSHGFTTPSPSHILTASRRALGENSGSGSWVGDEDDRFVDVGSGSWDDNMNATNVTYHAWDQPETPAVAAGPYYTPWEQYEITIITYVTDKYKAESRRQASVTVYPPVMAEGDGDGTASLAASLLDGVVAKGLSTGDLATAAQATSSTVDMLNTGNDTRRPIAPERPRTFAEMQSVKRALQEVQDSEEGQNRSALRERMMEIAMECANGSPDTAVGRQATFQLLGGLTASAGEVNENITRKGVAQMQATLSGAKALDASAGGDATGALSNMLFSAGLDAAVPIDDDVIDGNGTNITNATRRAVVGLNNDTIFATLSYANMTVGEGHGNFTVGNATCEELGFGCEECSFPCGVSLSNGDFESRGSCFMGDCVCNAYPCAGARCIRTYYEQDPDGCYTIDDHCFNNTCYSVDCELGWCEDGESGCVPGRCVPQSNSGGDGALDCFEGACPLEEQFWARPECEKTQEAKARELVEAAKEAKCLSDKIQRSVDSVSGGILGGRVTGEDDVPIETGNIKMKSARKTPANLAGPVTTPGSDAKMGIPGDAVDPDSEDPVDVQAKSWAVNPFGYSESSMDLVSDVLSLSLSIDNNTVAEDTPYVLEMPTPAINMTAPAELGPCPNECSSPRKSRRPPQGRCVDGKCMCYRGFTGFDCSVKAKCQYWDFAADAWSEEGCVVAEALPDRTVCHCTHLSDFGSAMESAMPDMNLVNPFDMSNLDSFAEDPRNIMSLALVVGLYFTFGYLMYSGWKKDKADRHAAYVNQVLESIKIRPPPVAVAVPVKDGGVVLSEDDDIPEEMLRKRDKAKRGCIAVAMNRLHVYLEWWKRVRGRAMSVLADAHPWVSCVYVQPEDPFTRPQRMIVLLAVIMGNIVLCALFFEVPPCGPRDEGFPNCPGTVDSEEDPPMEIIPGYLDVETLMTAVIVALLMMPCDRLFIGMFAKIRPPGLAVEGITVTGKAYSLPKVTPTEDELVRKLQAKFRGNQQRQKLRSMNAVMESYLIEDIRKPRNPADTILLASKKFDRRSFVRNTSTLNAEDRGKPEQKKSTLDASQLFQGSAAKLPPTKLNESRGAAATLMNSGAEFKRTRAFPTTANPSVRVGGGTDAGKRNAMIAAGTMLSTARQLGRSGRLGSDTRSLSPTRSPRRFSNHDDYGAAFLEPEPEPQAELRLDEPAGRSNLVSLSFSRASTTFQQRLQGGTGPVPPGARAGSTMSSSSTSRAKHTMPSLLPKMSDTLPVVPRPPPPAAKGVVVRKRLFALPGADEVAMQYNPAGSRQDSRRGRRGQSEPPDVRRTAVARSHQEMPAEKMLRLVIWVQASFRGMKCRSDLRQMMAITASKEEQVPDRIGSFGKAAGDDPAMQSAGKRAKAKHKAKVEAQRQKEAKQSERQRKQQERETKKRLMRKFKKLDLDNSGALDQAEVAALIESLGMSLNKKQLKVAMEAMDADGSGEIDFEEFSGWWMQYSSKAARRNFFDSIIKKDEETPEEVAAREYQEKVQKAAEEVKKYAKLKRKGKHRGVADGLWPNQMVWVTYFLTVLFCLFCGLYTVMVALTFGPETTAKWLGGFITTTGYQALVQDPVKIALVVLFADAAEFWLELYYEFLEFMPFDISFLMEEA